MHQALRISQLTGLPAPIQQTAQRALNGSLENLHQLVIGMSELSDPQAFLLLPVFYHTIQKLATPTIDELDDPDIAAMNTPVRKTLTMAFAAIRGVVKLGIGKSVPIPGRCSMSGSLAAHGELASIPANISRKSTLVRRPLRRATLHRYRSLCGSFRERQTDCCTFRCHPRFRLYDWQGVALSPQKRHFHSPRVLFHPSFPRRIPRCWKPR
ncbi:hypothetical protein DFH06DRAFT_726851 [Mycena polygramma]|nr:hypothetical protein DFH06DRAFT_726851 [Mycena polygramma]